MQFFDLKRPAKLGLSIPEQKHRWLREFLKAFMVVFMVYFCMCGTTCRQRNRYW